MKKKSVIAEEETSNKNNVASATAEQSETRNWLKGNGVSNSR
jgi:hypothetical protein